jgi:hypothetical protein
MSSQLDTGSALRFELLGVAWLTGPIPVTGFDVVAVCAKASKGSTGDSSVYMVEVKCANVGERAMHAPVTATASCL